uniref:Uncharacterized protein n=1 Tax=Mus musculus TaxID=10090 RepID=Q3V0M7_MOUSE|nr:unnamed protein product [Mus musculus]
MVWKPSRLSPEFPEPSLPALSLLLLLTVLWSQAREAPSSLMDDGSQLNALGTGASVPHIVMPEVPQPGPRVQVSLSLLLNSDHTS